MLLKFQKKCQYGHLLRNSSEDNEYCTICEHIFATNSPEELMEKFMTPDGYLHLDISEEEIQDILLSHNSDSINDNEAIIEIDSNEIIELQDKNKDSEDVNDLEEDENLEDDEENSDEEDELDDVLKDLEKEN